MKKKIQTLFVAALAMSTLAHATTRKVLYIGNSYTATNNLPAIVDSIATAMGDTIIYDVSAPGGYTFQMHSTNATTLAKIAAQQWDVVILKEQSQRPAFPPSQVATEVYPYARILDSLIHANDSCTQTMFMMTWGRANGDASNCASYPVICTYSGMQMRLRESYLQMAVDNHGDVIPVGNAFRIMMDSAYTPWLYSPDSSHPSLAGSYLQACNVYSSIFHRPVKNCSFLAGLIATDASLLKRVSDKVVFDSLALWQGTGHYPNAYFTHDNGTRPTHFYHFSPSGTRHNWSFGDGGTDTAMQPTHNYASGSRNSARLTVTTACFTETMSDSVTGPLAVSTITRGEDIVSISLQPNQVVAFDFLKDGYSKLEIVDARGTVVRRIEMGGSSYKDVFVPGLYIFRLSGNGVETVTGKVSVW